MRLLFLGEIDRGQTSFMRMRAFERLGYIVYGVNTMEPWKRASWLSRQVQRRLQFGSVVDEINRSVLTAARAYRPTLVWAEKQEFLRVETLEGLRKLGARLIHFTPDPYFTVNWKRTRLMDAAMKAFDVLVYCKSYEKADYEAAAQHLVYMPLGYCDEVHRPLNSDDPRWLCALGFLGGWDPRREEFLVPLAQTGLGLKIWGGYWKFLEDGRWTVRRHIIMRQLAGKQEYRIHRNSNLAACLQGGEVYDDDYARALTGAKIGIGFLRTTWPDQHTTRTFEIPACGSMLLADRTAEHQEFFKEGEEAEFFSSGEELLDKARFYCDHEPSRKRIAVTGFKRCLINKYAYVHRLKAALNEIQRC